MELSPLTIVLLILGFVGLFVLLYILLTIHNTFKEMNMQFELLEKEEKEADSAFEQVNKAFKDMANAVTSSFLNTSPPVYPINELVLTEDIKELQTAYVQWAIRVRYPALTIEQAQRRFNTLIRSVV